jgi:hypothetical protein
MWDELGIAPIADLAAIRRAYAARLKQTRPDDDPEGFRSLRAAFEQALARAERMAADLSRPRADPAELEQVPFNPVRIRRR